jgi:methyl-accepting chemotaxis protein
MKTWFLHLPLLRKQLLLLLLVGLIPMLIIGTLSYNAAQDELKTAAFNQLTAVRDLKASAVERHFKQLHGQITSMAMSQDVQNALQEFTRAFNEMDSSGQKDKTPQMQSYYQGSFGGEFTKRTGRAVDTAAWENKLSPAGLSLQKAYIRDNSHPLGEKHKLDAANDSGNYHQSHKVYHPRLRHQLESFGYYDIFIVDNRTGNVVYTVFKELDYATNLKTGTWAGSGLAKVFNASAQLNLGESQLVDFAPYLPSYNAPAAFIASPIYIEGQRQGTLIIQVPIEPINAIMQERSGMGKTGETYLIGSDSLMRSDSYLDPKNHTVMASFAEPKTGQVKTQASQAALNQQSGAAMIVDYNNNPVLSAYKPIALGGFTWAILAEIDVAEALASAIALRNQMAVLCVLMVAAILAVAFFSSKMLSAPVLAINDLIRRVQNEGNFQLHVKNDYRDEIGTATRAFNQFLADLGRAFTQVNDQLRQLSDGKAVEKISESYPGDLGALVTGVNKAAEQIQQAREAQRHQATLAEKAAQEAQAAAADAKAQATQTLIVKQALDVCGTAVMIANEKFEIIYANDALNTLMRNTHSQMQKAFSALGSASVVGQSLDVFYPNAQEHRQRVQELTQSHQARRAIAELTVDVANTPIRSNEGQFLGVVVEWNDRTEELQKLAEEQRLANENARIRQALDASSTSTLITDENDTIIYTNHALATLMQHSEKALRSHLPSFNASRLIGAPISQFESLTALNTRALSALTAPSNMAMEAADKTFAITASPIRNSEQQRLGTVVEWVDRSSEVAIEKEIDHLIQSASQGDFSQRLNLTNKDGFFKRVSEGLNTIVSTTNVALQDVIRVLGALAQGDLSLRIERDYQGEFALLKRDTNTTLNRLNEIIFNISQASQTIATSTSEISAGTTDLSARTEEQASSLEETAASMEEITQIVRKSQDNALTANQLTAQAVNIARAGDKSVEQTAVAMKAINEASSRIANIIGVIDELAFQTNLLALNAAVEAARAGEQGRGFAVVAGEVRNLAQRSAGAAKEIKSLIADSVQKVNDGTSLVESSRSTLRSIVHEVLQVSEMMQSIVNSATEQTQGIEQINTALLQMDQITQQNAALVEEASAASETMADQARAMDDMLQFFKRAG